MTLTKVGTTLFSRAEAIEMHFRQAAEEVRAVLAGDLAEFRLGAGAAYHMTIAPDLVKRLSSEFPNTRFILDFDVAVLPFPS
jgi:DNA-binding transcriptional LysR family regulator